MDDPTMIKQQRLLYFPSKSPIQQMRVVVVYQEWRKGTYIIRERECSLAVFVPCAFTWTASIIHGLDWAHLCLCDFRCCYSVL